MKRRRRFNFGNRQLKGDPPLMTPTAQINLPFASVAGFTFNVNSLVAIDLTCYVEGQDDRVIMLYLVGPFEHEFANERADKAYYWYLNLTGQNRVASSTSPLT